MSNTLPDPNNPQVGDRFKYGVNPPLTIRYVGKRHAVVEYGDGTEYAETLDWIARNCTPVPPPTPGPDEVFVPIGGDGVVASFVTAHESRAVDCYPGWTVVRYVKADPQ